MFLFISGWTTCPSIVIINKMNNYWYSNELMVPNECGISLNLYQNTKRKKRVLYFIINCKSELHAKKKIKL